MSHSANFSFSQLSSQEQQTLLSQFPKNIKLSYEIVIHNKVYESMNKTDYSLNKEQVYMAIPKGKKVFFWSFQGNLYSLSISLNPANRNQIENIQKLNMKSSLEENIIFYGTLFFIPHLKKQCVSIEDIFYYQNQNISHRFYIDKFEFIKKILETLKNSDSKIAWGLPILKTNYSDLIKNISELDNKISIYCILIRFLKENKPSNKILYSSLELTQEKIQEKIQEKPIEKPIEKTQEKPIENKFKINVKPMNKIQTKTFPKMKMFHVKPDLQNDIYHLYEDGKYVDVAYIPDFKTSVMMNQLFRKIKENENLDALEESDDEEEFENEKEDRFVYLDKVLEMKCYLHPKFRKWCPLREPTVPL